VSWIYIPIRNADRSASRDLRLHFQHSGACIVTPHLGPGSRHLVHPLRSPAQILAKSIVFGASVLVLEKRKCISLLVAAVLFPCADRALGVI
jgi:hypothetical protein